MSKTTITLSIDSDVKDILTQEKNYSRIVNELLRDYFNKTSHLKKDELKHKIGEYELKKKEINQKMKEIRREIEFIEAKEERMDTIFKGISKGSREQ